MTTIRSVQFPSYCGLVVLSCLCVSPASAQPTLACETTDYREKIRAAVQESEVGNLAEAKLLFSDAHKICPNARTLRGLGVVAYALRDYVSATDLLAASLASEVRPLTAAMRGDVSNSLQQSRHFEARLELEVTPSGAELQIDDEAVKFDDAHAARVNPGPHVLSARLAGFRSETRQVQVEAGGRKRILIELQPDASVAVASTRPPSVEAPAPVPPPASVTPEASGLGTQRIVAIIAGGVGVAALGVGAAFGIKTISDHDEAEKYCDGSACSDARGRDAGNAARTAGNISTVAMVIGLVGVGAGVTLWLTGPSERAAASVTFAPGMVRLQGAF